MDLTVNVKEFCSLYLISNNGVKFFSASFIPFDFCHYLIAPLPVNKQNTFPSPSDTIVLPRYQNESNNRRSKW